VQDSHGTAERKTKLVKIFDGYGRMRPNWAGADRKLEQKLESTEIDG
jgi:hypothetical protein